MTRVKVRVQVLGGSRVVKTIVNRSAAANKTYRGAPERARALHGPHHHHAGSKRTTSTLTARRL